MKLLNVLLEAEVSNKILKSLNKVLIGKVFSDEWKVDLSHTFFGGDSFEKDTVKCEFTVTKIDLSLGTSFHYHTSHFTPKPGRCHTAYIHGDIVATVIKNGIDDEDEENGVLKTVDVSSLEDDVWDEDETVEHERAEDLKDLKLDIAYHIEKKIEKFIKTYYTIELLVRIAPRYYNQ